MYQNYVLTVFLCLFYDIFVKRDIFILTANSSTDLARTVHVRFVYITLRFIHVRFMYNIRRFIHLIRIHVRFSAYVIHESDVCVYADLQLMLISSVIPILHLILISSV